MVKAGTVVHRVSRVEPLKEALAAFDRASAEMREGCKVFAAQFQPLKGVALPGLNAEATRELLVGHYGLNAEFGNGLNVVSQLDFMLPTDRRDGLRAMLSEPGQLSGHAREASGRGARAGQLRQQAGLPENESKHTALSARVGLMRQWVKALPESEAKQEVARTVDALANAAFALDRAIGAIVAPEQAKPKALVVSLGKAVFLR